MEWQTGEEGEQSNEAMNNSMDMTMIQEDSESMDESQVTEDLQVTLQEAMALRKNLESKFEEEILAPAGPSIQEKIAHFEKRASINRKATSIGMKKPPATIVTTKDTNSNMDRLKVFLRVRPCTTKESSTIEILDNADGKSLPTAIRTYPPESSNAAKTDRPHANGETHSIKEYEFSSVLGPSTSQKDVFEKAAAPLVNGLCSGKTIGKSALLFCYGITNAGKTHTILGDPRKQEAWGIIPRCISTAMHKTQNTDMELYLSCFEIYNEQLLDLLPSSSDPHGRQSASLKIRESHNGTMVIPGLAEYKVDAMETALSLIRRAKEGRHTAPNHLNRHSSRSHSVFQITIRHKKSPTTDSDGMDSVDPSAVDQSHLWIVDLAGNERSKRTNAGSLRQKEATYINMSLMNLMRCLTSTQKPYRDSKLTLLFMHHWSDPGNQTTMIVNVHGSASDYDETQHVLSYAISSKTIPIVASKAQVAKKQNLPEYGLDGRRKGAKPLTMVQKAARMIRKLSPKRPMPARKRKNQVPPDQENKRADIFREDEVNPVSKKMRRDLPSKQAGSQRTDDTGTSAQVPSSRELSSLRMQLSVARAEIQGLETKNRELTQKIEQIETEVRSEVAEEMLEQMRDIRHRYESTIQKLKDSFMQTQSGQDSDVLERAESKIDELIEKVEECEEEMSRMDRIHRAAVKSLEEQHESTLQKKTDEIENLRKELLAIQKGQYRQVSPENNVSEISDLKQQLASALSENEKLKKSKEELIKNYEQLMDDGEDEEEDGDSSLKNQLTNSRAQVSQLKRNVEQLKRTKDELEKKYNQLKLESTSEKARMESETADLVQQLADSRSEVETLERKLAEASNRDSRHEKVHSSNSHGPVPASPEQEVKCRESQAQWVRTNIVAKENELDRIVVDEESSEEKCHPKDDHAVTDADNAKSNITSSALAEASKTDDEVVQTENSNFKEESDPTHNPNFEVDRKENQRTEIENEMDDSKHLKVVCSSSKRRPFGRLTDNTDKHSDTDSNSDDSAKWLQPRRMPPKDPKTGLYPRPKGRAPLAADAWDSTRGAWRLSESH